MKFGLKILVVAGVAGLALLQGCSGTSAGMPVGPATAIVPTITIAPSPSLAIPAGELPYVVSVSGPSGDATPVGTVVILTQTPKTEPS